MKFRKIEKQWLLSRDILVKYQPYNCVTYGKSVAVDPRKIIGLSFPVEQIRNDAKMKLLRQKVKENGWDDPSPGDCELALLPAGNYIVDSGGNHRAFLSNELNIGLIRATVRILIPNNLVPESLKDQIEYLLFQYEICNEQALNINQAMDAQGRYTRTEEEDILYDKYCSKAEKMFNDFEKKLLVLAEQLRLLP